MWGMRPKRCTTSCGCANWLFTGENLGAILLSPYGRAGAVTLLSPPALFHSLLRPRAARRPQRGQHNVALGVSCARTRELRSCAEGLAVVIALRWHVRDGAEATFISVQVHARNYLLRGCRGSLLHSIGLGLWPSERAHARYRMRPSRNSHSRRLGE